MIKNFKEKIRTNDRISKKDFLNDDKLLGSAYDADSEGEEGKYYVYDYDELKSINSINEYFDISDKGNWENKNILVEKKSLQKK